MKDDAVLRAQLKLLLVVSTLTGCTNNGVADIANVELKSSFNPAEYEPYKEKGTSTVYGRVTFKSGDSAIACTNFMTVSITPASPWTLELLDLLNRGVNLSQIADANLGQLSVRGITRTQYCDGGGYRFRDLPAGRWLVVTSSGKSSEQTPHPRWLSRTVDLPPDTNVQIDLEE